MAQPRWHYKGFNGERIDPRQKNPAKDLTLTQLKIYNFLRGVGPKTEKQISIHPAFHDISDVGRALRKMREFRDPDTNKPIYVDSFPQRKGPQKWAVPQ